MRLNQRHYKQPRVFISSTADHYAREVRAKIKQFLEKEVGYVPLMWEDGKYFPYVETDDARPADDGIQAVRTSDMYVLLLGKSYGTIRENTKVSITHEEFIVADEMRIPIYAFVHESVWNIHPLYHANPRADFSEYVKDIQVFDFIDDLKNRSELVRPFSNGDDIVNVLRERFAIVMGALLEFSNSAQWLWCEETTEAIEGSANVIWVATPDLYWDAQNPIFRKVVRTNVVDRRIKYGYIIIDTPTNRERFRSMMDYYSQHADFDVAENVRAVWIPENTYPWPTEVAIYEPDDLNKRTAIIVNAMEVTNRDDKYNIQLGDDNSRRLHKQMGDFLS